MNLQDMKTVSNEFDMIYNLSPDWYMGFFDIDESEYDDEKTFAAAVYEGYESGLAYFMKKTGFDMDKIKKSLDGFDRELGATYRKIIDFNPDEAVLEQITGLATELKTALKGIASKRRSIFYETDMENVHDSYTAKLLLLNNAEIPCANGDEAIVLKLSALSQYGLDCILSSKLYRNL